MSESASSTAEGPQATVLYVEDDLSNIRLIERVLELRPGVTLLSATGGQLGLDLAKQHRPDMILLALHLPDIGGEEVLRRLRKEPEAKGVPVVIVSADVTPGQVQHLINEGAAAYLTKPLNVTRLLKLLDDLLEGKSAQEVDPPNDET